MGRGFAHEWSVAAVQRFISSSLNLASAAETLRLAGVNGHKLLVMSEDMFLRYGVESPLHRRKLVAHAQELREEALTALNAAKSSDRNTWNSWETAAWAAVEMRCEKTAMVILKRRHTFKSLCELEKEEMRQALRAAPSEERHRLVLELLQYKVSGCGNWLRKMSSW